MEMLPLFTLEIRNLLTIKSKVRLIINVRFDLILVLDYVKTYAGIGAAEKATEQNEADEEMSDAGSYHSDGEEEQARKVRKGL